MISQNKKQKMVILIAYLMILATTPTLYFWGIEKKFLPFMFVEWFCFAGFLVAGWGLFNLKEWARKLSSKVLVVYFLWILYKVNYQLRPIFKVTVEEFAGNFQIHDFFISSVMLFLIVILLLCPIIAVFFLTHPKVKAVFRPNYNPESEAEDEDS